jgi:hypothetical protein
MFVRERIGAPNVMPKRRLAVSDRTVMPVKSKRPTRMNCLLNISQDRDGAIPKADKILCRQPPVRDESWPGEVRRPSSLQNIRLSAVAA